jgi:hypothetical protein
MPEKIAIPHIAWRDGRPRFMPSDTLRKAGHKGHDLKADGAWMTEAAARAWSETFQLKLEGERRQKQERKARAKHKARAAIKRALPPAPVARSYTLGQLLDDFCTNGLAGNAPRTVELYRSWSRALEAEAPDAWLSEAEALSRPAVIGIYDRLLRTRKIHTARQAIRVLSSAWNWALDRGKVLSANPVFRIQTIEPQPRTRSASVAEYLHLLATADALGLKNIGDLLAWGVFTAQRLGDRLMIRQENLVDGRLEIQQIKTNADVSIRLARPLAERWQLRRHNQAFVIPDVASEKVSRRAANAYAGWKKLIAQAKKTMPSLAGLRDQDLRDTAVSWMGRAGCTTHQIFAVTGHRQQGETRILRHYMAVHNDIADAAIAKLEAWFDREVEKLKQQEERKAG